MQIIGHNLINFEYFNLIDDFTKVKDFDNLMFKFDENLIQKAQENNKNFSLIVENISQIVLANAFGAKYIIIDLVENPNLLKEGVKLAEFYLFDSKIATILYSKNELELAIKYGCDAVIFDEAINKPHFI